MNNPTWWNKQHDGLWDRTKDALKRDWEQTKADFSKQGHELGQSVGDTVKQAMGKELIPPANLPNAKMDGKDNWDHVEPAFRFGVGARQQYGAEHPRWDQRVESKLENEWTSLKDGRTWQDVKMAVRRAWDHEAS